MKHKREQDEMAFCNTDKLTRKEPHYMDLGDFQQILR